MTERMNDRVTTGDRVRRRLVAAVLVLAVGIGAFVLSESRPSERPPTFSDRSRQSTPRLERRDDLISASWFCGGVPAIGDTESGEYGGDVIVTNPTEVPASGHVTILATEGAPVEVPFDVEARSQTVIDLNAVVTANFVSAVVDVDAAEVSVEQRAIHPAGDAVAPCANATSSEWYVADGFSAEGSDFRLLVSNPYLTPAIVDIGISTAAGPRTPTELQGFVVPPRSLRVINMEESGFRDEPVVAVSVVATTGQIVVAKDQHFFGGGRLGHVTLLASPSLSDEWWFADGETGEGITERLVMFNPTESDVEADVVVLGLDPTGAIVDPTTLTVPSREVVVFDTAGIAGLDPGRHGLLVSTLSADSLVVERVISRPDGESISTSVILGAQSDAPSIEWFVAVTPDRPLEDALRILNVSAAETSIDVLSVGPGGLEPVAGLEGFRLAPNSQLAVDLTDELGVSRSIVIVSDQPVLVERRLPRTDSNSGRSASLALPVRS